MLNSKRNSQMGGFTVDWAWQISRNPLGFGKPPTYSWMPKKMETTMTNQEPATATSPLPLLFEPRQKHQTPERREADLRKRLSDAELQIGMRDA